MFYHTESKPQGWRAVAVFDDRGDRLIFLGRSNTQVRAGFADAYFEVLDEEERNHVLSVSLQRWQGAPDSGRHGTIVPGPPYQANGLTCREFTHTVYVDGRPQIARGIACRNPDGTWTPVG